MMKKKIPVIKGVDIALIVVSIILLLLLCIPVFVSATSTLLTVGDYVIVLSHLFVLPTVYLTRRIRWLAYIISITCVFSALYHFVKIADDNDDTKWKFEAMDEASQSMLIWLTTILVLFDDMPPVGFAFLLIIGVIVGQFGRDTLGFTDYNIFINILGIWSTIIFILYRFIESKCKLNTNFFEEKRRWQCLIIGFAYFLVAFICYSESAATESWRGSHEVMKYKYLHSMWHICAYTALYFIYKSRLDPREEVLTTIRIQRTQFAIQ